MTIHKTFAALALVCAAFGAQAASNLVVNGSFEANAQPANSWTIYSNLTSWTGGSHGIELRNHVSGSAQDGVNFVELDTTQNSSMSQNITFAHAGRYLLSFWYAARPDNGSRNHNTNMLEWDMGNSFSGTVLSDWAAPSATNWHHFTTQFNVQSAVTQALIFKAVGQSDSYGGSIDNVSITSAVPEPESLAMLLAGLWLVGTVARRRKAKKS